MGFAKAARSSVACRSGGAYWFDLPSDWMLRDGRCWGGTSMDASVPFAPLPTITHFYGAFRDVLLDREGGDYKLAGSASQRFGPNVRVIPSRV